MSAAPRLAVTWEPRWQGFRSAVGPALSRSPRKLALAEVGGGVRPSSMLASALLHFAAAMLVLTLAPRIYNNNDVQVRPLSLADYHVQYVPSPYLPALHDAGGAEAGRTGRSGGHTVFAPQPIRIANGFDAGDRLVKAPPLRLPQLHSDAANLVSVAAPLPIAPPAADVRRGFRSANLDPLAPAVAAPAEAVTLAQERRRARADEVAPPALASNLAGTKDTPLLPLPQASLPTAPEIAEIPSAISGVTQQAAPAARAPSVADITAGLGAAVALPSAQPALPGAPVVAPRPEPGSSAPGSSGNGMGAGSETAAILSTHPGTMPGVPGGNGTGGSFAGSPSGDGSSGLGGSGGGTGIGRGSGPGSGAAGEGPGAGVEGPGRGNDMLAHGGLAPGAGPGGAGEGPTRGGITGVAIQSGNVVSLPSFADPTPHGTDPRHAPSLTVIGTSRSGGALNAYGLLKSPKVYTIYLDTAAGTAILQFGERSGGGGGYDGDLTAPEPVRTDLPRGLGKGRLVVRCVIGKDGALRDFRVLEPSTAGVRSRIAAALSRWKFRPVLRGEQAIEVDAILGFAITTR